MANSRSQDLTPTTDKAGKTVSIDSASQGEAEGFSMDLLIGVNDIRVGTASLSAGDNTVLITDLGTVNYLVFINCYNVSGTVSCLISNKLTDRFTATVAYAATLDYIIFKT